VNVLIPNDTLESFKKVAQGRDMSVEALLRFYIGQGLSQDLARRYADRLLETTAHVLARHLDSEAEVSDILQEIQTETAV
jgi:hypothetical protein